MERGWRPSVEISPNCPRCGSSNTKFCYYNNYSLTQPRYFCKGCRRYWTKGGSLRNVPVGGGCRKNRRSGKSVRLPTDSVPSKASPSPTPNHGSTTKVIASASAESNASSHIDLALVYANFLNQQPENKSNCYQVPNLAREFDPNFLDHHFPIPTMPPNTNMDSSIDQLPPEGNGLIGPCLGQPHLSNNDQIYYNSGLESVHNHKHHDRVDQPCRGHESNEYALPPLPGEDLSSQEILWSNASPALHATQEPVLGAEGQDPNSLFGNWSPFDLSIDDTFSRS